MELLGLVMIVKNEAAGIAATLDSVRSWIDHWTILDTGSTDGTQELIRKALADIPGELHEEPFVDYSTSRNRVLDLHGETTRFTLMLSGDDILAGGDKLRTFLTEHALRGAEIYNLTRQAGTDRHASAAVVRTGTGWRYVGRTHEVINKPGCFATETIPDMSISRPRGDGTPEAKAARWTIDLRLLAEDLAADPTNSRAAFYLARTYDALGRCQEARDAYQRRIMMGGWLEEVYEAMFAKARMMEVLTKDHPWHEVQSAYLEAYACWPARAEPLFRIACHWHRHGQHALTYLFASRAAEIEYPKTAILFVDAAVYAFKAIDLVAVSAYFLGKQVDSPSIMEKGQEAGRKMIEYIRAGAS